MQFNVQVTTHPQLLLLCLRNSAKILTAVQYSLLTLALFVSLVLFGADSKEYSSQFTTTFLTI
jgi:hypothetical protein